MSKRIGLAKAGLYMFAATPAEKAALVAQVQQLAEAAAKDLPDHARQTVSAHIDEDVSRLPHLQVMANSPRAFDVVYQLSSTDMSDRTALVEAVAAMATALGKAYDTTGWAVFVGQEIAITRGDGPIYNVMPLRRVPALSHDEFMHHWFDRHADLGEGVDGVRYRQNHVDDAATRALAARTGLAFEPMDGLTESYFDSVDAAIAILSQDAVAIDAIADERLFIHHPRSQFGLNRIVWQKQPDA